MMLTMAPAAFATDEGTEETGQETVLLSEDDNTNEDDTVGGTVETESVAQVGDTTYTTLQAAISAAQENSGTVTLLKDVELSAMQEITGTLTIDLNGHTISNGTITNNNYMLKINSDAKLELVGNTANSAITDSRTNTTGTITAICVLGELHVKGDNLTISRGKGIAIKVDESGANKLGKLTVESGTISSDQAVQNWGISTINSGTFNGDVNSAAYSNIGGQLTINGGTFAKNVYTWQMKYPQVWPTVAAKIDIAGGTFKGTIAELYGNAVESLQPVTNVSFPTDGSCPEGVVSITGGTFSNNAKDYCAIGYTTQESNGTYQVVPTSGMEADASASNGNASASVGGSYNTNNDQNGDEVNTENDTIQIDVTTGTKEDGSSDPVVNETVTSATVSIANESLTSVKNSNNDVSLVTDVATLDISSDAWKDMTEAANKAAVKISVEVKKDSDKVTGWEITAKAGSEDVFTESTTSTIDVTVTYSASENAADVIVYCTDSGKRGPMKTTWDKDGGKLTWTTPHFSGFTAQEVAADAEATWVVDGESVSTGSGSLTEALNAVKDNGGTITLLKNIEVSNTADSLASEAIYTLPDGVTLDGAGYSITAKAEGWQTTNDYPQKNHILGVTAAGATVTIKNLTIVGHESTRHGINIWAKADESSQPNVTLENVKIQNCGTAAVVVNNGKVTATNLTTSGNTWGAVNVDNSGSFTLTGADNNMAEPVKIWTEKPAGSENATTITLTGSNFSSFDDVKGVGDNLKGYTYYTDDVSELGEAYNETTQTVYEDLDTALKSDNVSANNVITVVKNASLDSDASIPANVTLKVAEGVTLTIAENVTLTNNGTLENSGTISGTGSVAGTGKQTSIVTFSVTPSDASIVVKDSDGNEVSAVGGKYALENGKNYTYTVSKSGYRTQTSTFTVTKAETITVNLSTSGGGGGGGSSSSSGYAVSVSSASNGSVSVSPKNASKGSTVTITVTPNSGYELDELTVTDKNGDTVKLTNKGNGKYTFTMPASKVTVKAIFEKAATEPETPETPVFTDVSTSAYYYDAVEWAVEEGVTSGTTATTFSPNASCTRAQMVTFLWRANGSPKAGGTNPFTDVKPDAYYYDAVLWAVEKGITSGTSATTFSPDATVTRGQTVTFLYRANGSPAVSGSSSFADVAADAYYAAAVQWAVAENVTAGTSATTFSPNNACTRAQIVTFLYRDMA